MSRYIDVDELERMLNEATAIETKTGLMALVKLIPTIDIVRCEDCKYGQDSACGYSTVWVRPNGFCKWGERREDVRKSD